MEGFFANPHHKFTPRARPSRAMDFASILGSEIKKRKSVPATANSSSTASADTGEGTKPPPAKKYLRRSEVEATREAEYLAHKAALERERAEKAEQRRQLELEEEARQDVLREKKKKLAEESRRRREEEEARRLAAKGGGKPPGADGASQELESKEPEEEIPEEEVLTRLRKLEQPVRLFGETALQRRRRLMKLERGESPGGATPVPRSRSATPKISTLQLSEEEMKIDLGDVKTNSRKVYSQLAAWFRLVLREWDIALASRPLSVRTSYQGKAATSAFTQASQYMQPLFKHLEKKDLHPDVFPKVSEIVHHAQHRKYVTANDIYLRLSIGNAAWPIGVTMVGIHERSAREKLHEKGMAAHIMSDEVTRKFLQSIKRCLKFCQTRWPPEDQLQLMG